MIEYILERASQTINFEPIYTFETETDVYTLYISWLNGLVSYK